MTDTPRLRFKPIQLEIHRDVCLTFREDSFEISFGDLDLFYGADGKGAEKYLEWLRQKLQKDVNAGVHVWWQNQIIGQIELERMRDQPQCGYVNLLYLIPEFRGKGYGTSLNQYALAYFRKLGLSAAKLSVSPTNTVAIEFYKKQGWRDLGPRPGHPEVRWMEIKLASP